VCAVHCVQLLHTILHRTDLIIFPLTLQTITIVRWCLFKGKGGGGAAGGERNILQQIHHARHGCCWKCDIKRGCPWKTHSGNPNHWHDLITPLSLKSTSPLNVCSSSVHSEVISDLQPSQLDVRELSPSSLVGRHKSSVECCVWLRRLVKSASVELSREEVVSSSDSVNVSSQVQVELVHWNYLRIAATSGTTCTQTDAQWSRDTPAAPPAHRQTHSDEETHQQHHMHTYIHRYTQKLSHDLCCNQTCIILC